jgi:callose synthase
MMMEIGLEQGFCTTLWDFIVMQLQLGSVFFSFSLGTKAHYVSLRMVLTFECQHT